MMSVVKEAGDCNAAKAFNLNVQWGCAKTSDFPDEADLLRWAEAALSDRSQETEVTIRIVDKSEMQAANNEWRYKNQPTNVLSFPADFPPETGINYLGDILICADVLREESVQQDKVLHAHWAHIVVHGVLHLQGYDHEEEQGAREMEALEVEILATLDYTNPYESPSLESGKS